MIHQTTLYKVSFFLNRTDPFWHISEFPLHLEWESRKPNLE